MRKNGPPGAVYAYIKVATGIVNNRKTLRRMLQDVWHGHYTMSFYTNLVIAIGLLYIIIPLDFDWIPFLGWIDDGIVAVFILKRLGQETHRYNRRKAFLRRSGA